MPRPTRRDGLTAAGGAVLGAMVVAGALALSGTPEPVPTPPPMVPVEPELPSEPELPEAPPLPIPVTVGTIPSTANLRGTLRVTWDGRGAQAVVDGVRHPVVLRGPGLEGATGTHCYSVGGPSDFGPLGPQLQPGEYLVLHERGCEPPRAYLPPHSGVRPASALFGTTEGTTHDPVGYPLHDGEPSPPDVGP